MNRRQRRAAAKRYGEIRVGSLPPGASMEDACACPDCDSDVTIIEVAPGIYSGEVFHDETCPWFQSLQRRCQP